MARKVSWMAYKEVNDMLKASRLGMCAARSEFEAATNLAGERLHLVHLESEGRKRAEKKLEQLREAVSSLWGMLGVFESQLTSIGREEPKVLIKLAMEGMSERAAIMRKAIDAAKSASY